MNNLLTHIGCFEAFLEQKTRAKKAERLLGALRAKVELFANELEALGSPECAKQLRDEVLAGEVIAPTYNALKAELAAARSKPQEGNDGK